VANQSITKSPHRVRHPSEDKARREHGGYAESSAKLELQREEGLERTSQRLAEQREELARQARVTGTADALRPFSGSTPNCLLQ
jgi:hypothetical protein